VNSFFVSETNKDNIIQQLFLADESFVCFNQLSSRHRFKHFNQDRGEKMICTNLDRAI